MDRLTRVSTQADEVKTHLFSAIVKVQARGEKLEDLDQKAEDLQKAALQFKNNSRRLKFKMMCKNWKYILIIFLMFCFVLVLIIWACGGFR